ncbi:DUF262 domain-containing protein [Clostridium botulinum]|nr:hypothetical protein KU40_08840 [Clostridium botulinum]MBY6777845.1 DUF262 domain-containing protein [Clostridium botulinum]MBY6851248.1 DUF262 domain-containing protein [Clostridium botulinum]NFF24122.1 DUF262 domain-containing protein [Clostridium botulinum]NFI49140.1 DUF262 domain-containing protein [Clostridium botulinum]
MNLQAYTRNVRDILDLNRKYIIPRFQREYAWEEAELSTLWEDIFANMNKEKSAIKENPYFIGSLVLVGDDSKDSEFEVVDGQQRLTTITILLSAISEMLRIQGDEKASNATYKYIEGTDDDDNSFFKLVNENPKPFLQCRIQAKEKDKDYKASTEEEKKLLYAYNFFIRKLDKNNLDREQYKFFGSYNKLNTLDMIKLIRSQVLAFKTIFITVESLNEAYIIFETLNAKGKNLESIDLVKNRVFKVLSKEHPTDFAKDKWKKMKGNLYSRTIKINLSTFYRHYWISRYPLVTNQKLYEEFIKKINKNEIEYKKFMNELEEMSEIYTKIVNPNIDDYKLQEEKFIYDSLSALCIFDVIQVRTIILALLSARKKKLISLKDLKLAIESLEKFHFIFTAVCSSRASNIERMYSKHARHISSCKDRDSMNKAIKNLVNELKEKVTDFNVFRANFNKIVFTNENTQYKKLIQYIFKKIELYKHRTKELSINIISLEHILSQSTKSPYMPLIGNLIPLDKAINSDMGDIDFDKKIEYLKKSELYIVKEFVSEYEKKLWNEEEINKRTDSLAELAYNEVWKI